MLGGWHTWRGPRSYSLIPCPLHWKQLTCVTKRKCRNDGVWLPKLGHKKTLGFPPRSLGSHTLRKAKCHVMRTSKQPCDQVHVKPSANNQHITKPPWNDFLQPWPSLQMTAAPNDILTAPRWEPPSQSFTVKMLLNSWSTETVRDNKCLLSVFWFGFGFFCFVLL